MAEVSLTGSRHGHLNQDTAFTRQAGPVTVAAVFDGHGLLGENAAAAAAGALADFCSRWEISFPVAAMAAASNAEQLLQSVFAEMQEAVLCAHAAAPETCVLVVQPLGGMLIRRSLTYLFIYLFIFIFWWWWWWWWWQVYVPQFPRRSRFCASGGARPAPPRAALHQQPWLPRHASGLWMHGGCCACRGRTRCGG